MERRDILAWVVIIASVSGLVVARMHREQDGNFPQRGVTLVVPYSPGGGTDLLCRGLARAAEPHLGENITVSNLTGGGGAVGFTSGLLSPADGHTVTAVTIELLMLPIQGLVPFTHEDFHLLMRVNLDPGAVTVRSDFPAETLEDFIEIARSRSLSVSIGTGGAGTAWHMAGAMLAESTQIDARFIPFNGAAPAITALVGGHIDAVTVSPGEVRPQVLAGQLKILAVMNEQRVSLFPNVPTCRELGYDVVFGAWRGLAVPRETPAAAREKLVEVFEKAMESRELVQLAENSGLNLAPAGGDEFRRLIRSQADGMAKIMKRLGLAR